MKLLAFLYTNFLLHAEQLMNIKAMNLHTSTPILKNVEPDSGSGRICLQTEGF